VPAGRGAGRSSGCCDRWRAGPTPARERDEEGGREGGREREREGEGEGEGEGEPQPGAGVMEGVWGDSSPMILSRGATLHLSCTL
jgi:hypothetical protein